MSIRVVFAGTPAFALPCLEALFAAVEIDLLWVYTQPDQKSGRRLKMTSPPVKLWCSSVGVECRQPRRLGDKEAHDLKKAGVDFLLVAAYGQIVPASILTSVRVRALNVHGSLLPRWRGASPIVSAILAGDKRTGFSIMEMEKSLDTGPVYKQKSVDIVDQNTEELTHWIAVEGAKGLVEVVMAFDAYQKKCVVQNDALATYAPKVQKSDARVSWEEDARSVERHIRAYYPAPGAFSYFQGQRIKFLEAEIVKDSCLVSKRPGTIVAFHTKGLYVQCSDGHVWVKKLQIPSKKPFCFTQGMAVLGLPFYEGGRFEGLEDT